MIQYSTKHVHKNMLVAKCCFTSSSVEIPETSVVLPFRDYTRFIFSLRSRTTDIRSRAPQKQGSQHGVMAGVSHTLLVTQAHYCYEIKHDGSLWRSPQNQVQRINLSVTNNMDKLAQNAPKLVSDPKQQKHCQSVHLCMTSGQCYVDTLSLQQNNSQQCQACWNGLSHHNSPSLTQGQ